MGAQSHPHQSLKEAGVDNHLADRALRALLKHHESSSSGTSDLLGNDLDVQVQFGLVRVPGNPSPKPIRVEIPHPLVKLGGPPSSENDGGGDAMEEDDDDDGLQDVEACFIVKEESKPWVQEMVSRFPDQLGCVKKVLGLQSLRTKHKSFAQRRELLNRFDVFLADDRILPMLTRALGGKFFEKKKQPVPVRLTRKEALPFAVRRCLDATFMYLSAGTCVTVKAGNTAMPPAKLLANIKSICSIVPAKVPRKWSNVLSISIKTTASVALPIYNKTPEELEEIARLAKEEGKKIAEEEEQGDGEEDGSQKKKRKASAAASSDLAKALKKQRAVDEKEENDEVAEKPKKSSKKKGKGPIDEPAAVDSKAPKSSKKKRKETIGGDEDGAAAKEEEEQVKEEEAKAKDDAPVKTPAKTPKSSKKRRKGAETTKEEAKEDEVKVKSDNLVKTPAKTPKSSQKNRKEAHAMKEEAAATEEDQAKEDEAKDDAPAKTLAKTPKSSKKKRKGVESKKEEAEAKGEEQAKKEEAKVKNDAPAKTPAKTPKSSKKKRKGAEANEEEQAKEEEAKVKNDAPAKTPKSSKKKRKGTETMREEVEAKAEVKEEGAEVKTPKSSKKRRGKADDGVAAPSVASSKKTPKKGEDADFVSSKRFAGPKKGYVFKKGGSGVGYYKDVLPVVDKEWLATLGKKAGRGGGGGRKSMGHSLKRKKGGRSSRKSY